MISGGRAFVLALALPSASFARNCEGQSEAYLRVICEDAALHADWNQLTFTLRRLQVRAPDDDARQLLAAAYSAWRDALQSWVPEAEGARDELSSLIRFETKELPRLADWSARCGHLWISSLVDSLPGLAGLWVHLKRGLGQIRLLLHRNHPSAASDRLCTVQSEWASGHITISRFVDEVRNGQVSHEGHCIDADWAGSVCPIGVTVENAHWNSADPDSQTGWPFDGVRGDRMAVALSPTPSLVAWDAVGSDARDWLQTCRPRPSIRHLT